MNIHSRGSFFFGSDQVYRGILAIVYTVPGILDFQASALDTSLNSTVELNRFKFNSFNARIVNALPILVLEIS